MDYGEETIGTAHYGYVQLYGCRPKSVSAGLDCGLRWTPVLSVTNSADTEARIALH